MAGTPFDGVPTVLAFASQLVAFVLVRLVLVKCHARGPVVRFALVFLVNVPFVCVSHKYLLGMWPWDAYMLQPPPPPRVEIIIPGNQSEL
jgi:hypothetical protein